MAADSRIKWPGWETARQIGQGNYGSVYEIQQITPHGIEKAAMKFVSIPRKDGDIAKLLSAGYDRAALTRRYENYLKGIVEEYAHLSEVKGHPNIVRCDEVRYNRHPDGIGWDVLIKMPLLTPLMSAMNGLSPRELSDTVLHVGRDISGALVFCGTQKLLHRDIKPQNIFVNAAGNFMLGDFGVAGLYEEIWNGAGTSTGVSAFLAPEICNRQAYGPKADVYSLGLTLYYLLNERRLPFLPLPPAMVTPELANQALSRRLKGEPLPPPKNGDPKLKTLIQLACAFDPQKRCSAEQLWEGMKVLTAIAANSASAAPKAAAPASPPPAAPTAPGSTPRTAPPAAGPAAAPKPAAPAPAGPSARQATAPASMPPASAPVIPASATSTPAAPKPAAPAPTAAAPKPATPATTAAAPKPATPAPTAAAPKPATPAPTPAAPKPAAPASSPAAPRSAAAASGVPRTATPTAAPAAPEAPRRVQQNSLRRDLPPQGPVGSAPPVSAPPPASPPAGPTPPESTPPRNGGKKKRSKAPWIAAACIAVILIAAGALWVTGVIPSLMDRFFPSDTPPAELVVTDAPDPTRQPTAEPGPGSTAGPGNTAQPVVTADPGSAAEPGQTADPAVTADPGSDPEPTPTDGSDPEPDDGPTLPELVWSQWDDHLPGRVSGENSAIEMRLVYRSVPLLEVVDGDAPEGPYIKAEERTEYSEYDYANAYVTTTMPEADDLTQWTEEPVTASMWSAWKCWVPDYQTPKGKYQSRDNFTGKDAITYNGVAWGTIYRDYLGEKTVQINYNVVKRHRYDYYYDDEAWSEYSPEPITQAKDVLVMSKMQYRYAASENGTVAEPSMENFPVFDENYIGRFRDIPEDAWYAPEKSSILRTVCELGILLPDRRMNFRPEDPVTLGQVIRAAVMIHRIYNGSAPLLTENDGNYQHYLDYAVAHGLMRAGELTDLGREATRQEMAYLFCRALPEEELQAVREDINEIKDMDKAYVYYEYALRLARANIITLQQDDTFKPEDGATRAQLASIVDKLIYPRHR